MIATGTLIQKIERHVHCVEIAAGNRTDRGETAGDREENRERLTTLTHVVGRGDGGECGREQERGARALEHAEHDDPRLADRARRRGSTHRGEERERSDADDHDSAAAEHIRHTSTEGEQSGNRDEVSVDDPLGSGWAEVEVALEVRNRERDDRLIDEDHRHREDHGREDEVFTGALQGGLPV